MGTFSICDKEDLHCQIKLTTKRSVISKEMMSLYLNIDIQSRVPIVCKEVTGLGGWGTGKQQLHPCQLVVVNK